MISPINCQGRLAASLLALHRALRGAMSGPCNFSRASDKALVLAVNQFPFGNEIARWVASKSSNPKIASSNPPNIFFFFFLGSYKFEDISNTVAIAPKANSALY